MLSLTALLAMHDNAVMPTLTIRNLPDAVYRRLRVRAAHAGRSLEAEVREILARTEAMPAADQQKEADPVAAL